MFRPRADSGRAEKAAMSITHDFYCQRADEARAAADAATLDNVRELHLRAAAAWDVMARRAARTDRGRAETEARKAAAAIETAIAEGREPPSPA